MRKNILTPFHYIDILDDNAAFVFNISRNVLSIRNDVERNVDITLDVMSQYNASMIILFAWMINQQFSSCNKQCKQCKSLIFTRSCESDY